MSIGEQGDGTFVVEKIELDKETHIYSPALPSVTQILQDIGFIDSTWFTEESRDRGSRVHARCEDYDLGRLDWQTIDDEIEGYIRSYIAFRFAHKDMAFDWIEMPRMDRARLYAGTADRIIKARPKSIWDLKTGSPLPFHPLQLAAYANMDGDPFSYERHGLYLDKEGKHPKIVTYPKSDLQEDLADWNSALRIYYRKRKGK
jgi:hypothetical protein